MGGVDSGSHSEHSRSTLVTSWLRSLRAHAAVIKAAIAKVAPGDVAHVLALLIVRAIPQPGVAIVGAVVRPDRLQRPGPEGQRRCDAFPTVGRCFRIPTRANSISCGRSVPRGRWSAPPEIDRLSQPTVSAHWRHMQQPHGRQSPVWPPAASQACWHPMPGSQSPNQVYPSFSQ